VCYAATIEEDLSRRDFTMNAIALRLPKGEKVDCMRRVHAKGMYPETNTLPKQQSLIVDAYGGEADLKSRIIRCVGNPQERFAEDGLRPLRALRFAAQLSFDLEAETLAAIPPALETCAKVSSERVRDEIEKIIASDKPSRAFLPMEQTGLLRLFLPELAACRGVVQKGFHRFDVLDHSLLACDYAAARQFDQDVRIAALLHDVGKVPTRALGENGVWTFYQHEAESEKIARNILFRLRFPNALADSVCHLIKEHMFHYTDEWSDAAVRRFIVRAGEENLTKMYRLRRADAYATAGTEPPPLSRGRTSLSTWSAGWKSRLPKAARFR
jgi:putative nucleotidyltransferase with HDIG domain